MTVLTEFHCIFFEILLKPFYYNLFFLHFLLATDWKDHVVTSNSFDNPSGHQNPNSMPVNSYTKEADFVKVGAFVLSKGISLLWFDLNKCSFCCIYQGMNSHCYNRCIKSNIKYFEVCCQETWDYWKVLKDILLFLRSVTKKVNIGKWEKSLQLNIL